MEVSYTIPQVSRAERDVIEVYKLAEARMGETHNFGGRYKSCFSCQRAQLLNAFQVFRYAFREWALKHGEGVVLRALMLRDSRVREVSSNIPNVGSVMFCEDDEIAEELEKLLKGDGYEES